MDPNERFTDDEIKLILSRAAERQEQTSWQLPAGHGLTLAELESVASEAGIDPAHVASAAREIAVRRSQGLPTPLASETDELAHVRVVPSTISDEEWGRIVSILRTTFKKNGTVNQFGRIREWTSFSGTTGESGQSLIRVRLEPDGAGTAISVRQEFKAIRQLPNVLGGVFGSIAVLFATIVAAGGGKPGIVVLPIMFGALSGLSWLGGRFAFRSWLRKQDDQFRRVLDAAELTALKAESEPTE